MGWLNIIERRNHKGQQRKRWNSIKGMNEQNGRMKKSLLIIHESILPES